MNSQVPRNWCDVGGGGSVGIEECNRRVFIVPAVMMNFFPVSDLCFLKTLGYLNLSTYVVGT